MGYQKLSLHGQQATRTLFLITHFPSGLLTITERSYSRSKKYVCISDIFSAELVKLYLSINLK